MAKKIINPKITFVSLVEKGANKKTFFLIKSDDGNGELTVEAPFLKKIEKTDDGYHIVKCVIYSPNEIDSQGDFMDEETIEKFAHDFMENYRNVDDSHSFIAGFGSVVEGYIAPVDMIVNGEQITKGSFVGGFKINEEVYQKVINEEITGVSIGGTGQRINAEIEKADKNKNIISIVKEEIAKHFKNNNSEEEKDVEEVTKLIEALQKSVGEIGEKVDGLETKITESGDAITKLETTVDGKIDEVKKSITDGVKIEKSEKEKTEEKIVELEGELDELRKSIEAPEASIQEPTTKKPFTPFQ